MESIVKVGSLFSGGGLGDFGFMAAGMEIAWQCEIDKYCQKILALRYPESKKYTDIKTLKGGELEKVDIITGGFPCQPFSVAGKQHGKDDDRNLWPEMLRIIKAVKPRYVVAENVPGIIPLYLDTVLADLGNAGYTCWPFVFSSHSLGAWHKRERIWVVAYAESTECKFTRKTRSRRNRFADKSEIISDSRSRNTNGLSVQSRKQDKTLSHRFSTSFRNYWKVEPPIRRVVDGCPDRVHRLKCLGNGQCPVNTFLIGKFILEVEREYESKKM